MIHDKCHDDVGCVTEHCRGKQHEKDGKNHLINGEGVDVAVTDSNYGRGRVVNGSDVEDGPVLVSERKLRAPRVVLGEKEVPDAGAPVRDAHDEDEELEDLCHVKEGLIEADELLEAREDLLQLEGAKQADDFDELEKAEEADELSLLPEFWGLEDQVVGEGGEEVYPEPAFEVLFENELALSLETAFNVDGDVELEEDVEYEAVVDHLVLVVEEIVSGVVAEHEGDHEHLREDEEHDEDVPIDEADVGGEPNLEE